MTSEHVADWRDALQRQGTARSVIEVTELLEALCLADGYSAARAAVWEGRVSINGQVVRDFAARLPSGSYVVALIGQPSRTARVTVTPNGEPRLNLTWEG